MKHTLSRLTSLRAWETELESAHDLSESYRYLELERHLTQGDVVLGLVDSQKLAGFTLHRVVCDEAELLYFYVLPERRGRGLGAFLLNGFLTHLSRTEVTRVLLEVSDSNQSALRLYDKAGFKVIGRRKRYYSDGSTALVMHRELEPVAE